MTKMYYEFLSPTGDVESNIIKLIDTDEKGIETFIHNTGDPSNRVWQEYQDWLEAGNTVIPATPNTGSNQDE